MATSILDYTFRELAVSYLDRNDLGHVSKEDLEASATGAGEAQSELLNKVTSRGFIRKQGLVVYSNSNAAPATATASAQVVETTSLAPSVTSEAAVQTAATVATATIDKSTQVQQAKMQGYEGESCPECQNFTLVRNGTCLKCNTCGSTTGCS